MGGKTGTTSQSTTIPPEVLARYNSVNATAEKAAATPFQEYSSNPNAFVAPLNEQQQSGIGNVNNYASAAQPGYQGAMAGTAAASQGYNAQNYQQGVQGYMNPYLQNAMGSTAAMMQNQNQQQQNQLRGSAIQQGAFGGDRGNVAQAALMGQQNLAMGQTLGNMANQGYQNAAQNYMAGLGAQGALANQYGNLAGAAQTAGLQGAQAQLGAGTLGQQTEQAGKTAMYNQFLQKQAYPFQTAQFLANIAEGTGALSGSNTTTTQPMSFFSDRRLKHDIKHVGTADNGLPIYKFKYKGDDTEQTHIGFMAQDVEKVHPEAVGLSGGYKTVDYEKASEPVHKYAGGLVSEGGAVGMQHMGEGFAGGGYANDPYDPYSIQNILARQQNVYSAIDAHHVPMARNLAGGVGKHGRVPQANVPVGSLMKSGPVPQLPQDDAVGRASQIANLGETGMKYKERYDAWKASENAKQQAESQKGRTPEQGFNASDANKPVVKTSDVGDGGLSPYQDKELFAARGGLMGNGASETPQGLYSDNPNGMLDIPDENNAAKYKLLQEQKLAGSMQDPTVKDLQTAAAMAAMFMKSGGRAGYEEGGPAGRKAFDQDPDAIFKKMLQIESGGKQFAADGTTPIIPEKFRNDPDAPIGISQIKPSTAQGVAKDLNLDYDPSRLRTDEGYNQKLGRGYFGQHFSKYGDSPEKAVAAYNAGPGNVEKAIAAAGPGGNWKEYLPEETKNYISKVFGYGSEQPNLPAQTANMKSSPEAKEGKSGGLGDFFTTENVVPILTGLGAMASSKSPFLGAAALQGLGAGAEAYMGTQKAQADIRQSEAATKGMEFDTQRRSFQETPWGNIMWVQGPNGTAIPKAWSDYNPSTDIPAAPPSTGTAAILERYFGPPKAGIAAPAGGLVPREQPKAAENPVGVPPEKVAIAPEGIDIGQAPTDFYDANSAKTALAERQSKGAGALEGGPSAAIPIERSKVYISNIDKMGQAARNNQQNVHEMAANLADVAAAKGWDAPGTAYTTRAQISGIANTVSRIFGGEDILESDTPSQISNKLKTLQGLMAASGAGQESVRALDELANATANPEQNPKAFAKLSSMLMTQTQRAIDQSSHANLYGKDSGNSYIGAPADFERKNPSDRYTKEAEALSKVMINDPALFKEMMSGEMDPATIDKMFAKGGFDSMSRYFTGGR